MKRKKVTPTVIEVQEIDKQEEAAVERFKEQAQEAIAIIEENHFHLRLWKAVGGGS